MAPLTRNRAIGNGDRSHRQDKVGIRLSPVGVFNDMPVYSPMGAPPVPESM